MKENPKNSGSKNSLAVGILVGVAVIVVAIVVLILVTSGGKTPAPTPATMSTVPVTAAGISTFNAKDGAQICQDNGKPVVYLFSTTTCPHCVWIKDTFDSLMKQDIADGKITAYHWELNTGDNTLTPAVETSVPADQQKVYEEFSPNGYVPTFVFGCKYFRIGNGYEQQKNLPAEKAEFEAVINDLLK